MDDQSAQIVEEQVPLDQQAYFIQEGAPADATLDMDLHLSGDEGMFVLLKKWHRWKTTSFF